MYFYLRDYAYGTYQEFSPDSTNAISFDSTNLSPIVGNFSGMKAQVISARLETANIRYRLDGQDPTTTVGILMKADEIIVIQGYGNIANLRFIAVSGNPKLHVHFGFGGSSSKPA